MNLLFFQVRLFTVRVRLKLRASVALSPVFSTRDDIISDGYVVHSLEAAIWCLYTTNNYRDCVLEAVNLGEDTDTVAAIAGGLAGALYGYDDIPKKWLDTLYRRDYIEEMCERAFRAW
mgnify:CR=1 FL=1